MFSQEDARLSGAPLLSGAEQSMASDVDRGRTGHRTPRPSSPATPAALTAVTATNSSQRGLASSSRRRTLRSRSPAGNARLVARKKYTYAAVFLVLSLVSFTVQTELAAWVQRQGWDKAYCMLYLTHGSWSLLWPVQLLVLRIQKRGEPWGVFWRRHVLLVRSTARMVETQTLDAPPKAAYRGSGSSPWPYMARTTAGVTCALTVAGLSWYVAVNLTSPSDLTAIYNCSAFFAYAFSVPLLNERLRLDKSVAVLIAVAGVLVVAYGDAKPDRGGDGQEDKPEARDRLLGNLVIGAGSVLYGLYEVLYKRYACPPEGCSPGRGMIFANTFGSLVGTFTLLVLWIPLPLLHVLGLETFALPTGKVAWYLFLSVIMNATFAGSFLVLISLTSPVLSSVASLLTIFIVALSDWFLTGEPLSAAAVVGGGMIVIAFAMLSWSTYREMTEDERRKAIDVSDQDDSDSDIE